MLQKIWRIKFCDFYCKLIMGCICRWRSGFKIGAWSGETVRSGSCWRPVARASRRYRTRTTPIQIWATPMGIGREWIWATWARSRVRKDRRSKRKTRRMRRSMSRDKAHRWTQFALRQVMTIFLIRESKATGPKKI